MKCWLTRNLLRTICIITGTIVGLCGGAWLEGKVNQKLAGDTEKINIEEPEIISQNSEE
ncbi:MAG: hypothetical protein LBD57_04340 [Endomicrobium sp.]|jgi:CO dehydrogenase/acetyl-CoA synthase beta subunit|uniref:hypothetical protein n=1 Tax=Candidatus Endomicrobiellum cubanum TaxID=3242325 RepID=UPI002820DFEC|nr:hypothetical protein [Endomicrobium sp.]